MPAPPPVPPPLPWTLVDAEVRRLLGRLLRARVGLAPVIALIATTFLWLDPVPWRAASLLGLSGLVLALSALSAWRTRRYGVGRHALALNVAGMWAAQLVMITSTGGLDSPVLPVIVPLAIAGGLLDGRPVVVAALVVPEVVMVLGLAGLQAAGVVRGLAIPTFDAGGRTPAGHVLAGLVVATVIVVTSAIALGVRRMFEGVVAEAIEGREAQRALWEAHSRDLDRLTAGIAHELKNPLAAIKGLGALIARDLPEGRTAERLGVLRGEVDRMQAILEEFLTFSRPLSPLSLDEADLAAIATDVAALHEAEAGRRGQALRLDVTPARLRGDRRKLGQILINLVQNALQASPDGGVVTLRVRAEGDQVTAEVRDRGHGLPPAIAHRLFEAGVTGRPDGAGLGLPIAASLAQQHGGTLTLADHPEGGAVATVRLPAQGPPGAAP